MLNNIFKNSNTTTETKTDEKLFTKPERDGKIEFIEREVDKFDFDGYEVVRREFFSKATCPAVTFKYGSVVFNVRAIRKLMECKFIQILINPEKKLMIVKPCEEDEKDSLQWSRINKDGKVASRTITGKIFTAQLFKDMNWSFESTVKVLGTLLTCKDEKIFIFNLVNAEAYLHLAEPSADDQKRRKRVPFMPEHWQGNYGQSYEESKNQIIATFEGVPEGFVKITIPPLPQRKPPDSTVLKPPETELSENLFSESIVSSNTDRLNESVTEAQKDGI
jgi:hypothetical protein